MLRFITPQVRTFGGRILGSGVDTEYSSSPRPVVLLLLYFRPTCCYTTRRGSMSWSRTQYPHCERQRRPPIYLPPAPAGPDLVASFRSHVGHVSCDLWNVSPPARTSVALDVTLFQSIVRDFVLIPHPVFETRYQYDASVVWFSETSWKSSCNRRTFPWVWMSICFIPSFAGSRLFLIVSFQLGSRVSISTIRF